MTTDVKWTWTILMRDGKIWHCDKSIEIKKLLELYIKDKHYYTEIEAIIRH